MRFRYETATPSALDGIHLEIDAGEFVLLAGASGSGKSTLCRLLNGLIPHFHGGMLEGSVHVDGLDTVHHPVYELFAQVGLVFQNPAAQLFNSTVAREIGVWVGKLGLAAREIRTRTEWALQVTRLAPLASRAPHSLSGGEQQIVALAAILALAPACACPRRAIRESRPPNDRACPVHPGEIHTGGTAIVLAEHRLQATIQDATRLVVLDRGRVGPRRPAPRSLTQRCFILPAEYAFRSSTRPQPRLERDAVVRRRSHYDGTVSRHQRFARAPRRARVTHLPLRRSCEYAEFRSFERDVRYCATSGSICRAASALRWWARMGRVDRASQAPERAESTRRAARWRSWGWTHCRRVCRILATHVGFVFQNPNDQLFKLTVREEILVAPHTLQRFDSTWIERLLDWFELRPLLDRSPFTLSEGEKKRVAFGAALAAHPEVVVLDEPTTGQDHAFSRRIAAAPERPADPRDRDYPGDPRPGIRRASCGALDRSGRWRNCRGCAP